MRIAELTSAIVLLVKPRLLRLLDIDDCNSLFAISDVGVRASHIDIMRVGERNDCTLDQMGLVWRCQIDDFQTFLVNDETVAKLNCNRVRVLQGRLANLINYLRVEWIVNAHDHQTMIGSDVGMRACNRDVVSAVQHATRIERPVWISRRIQSALQIIVEWIPIK